MYSSFIKPIFRWSVVSVAARSVRGLRALGDGTPPDEPCAQRVVGDEEHPSLGLAPRHGLRDVVERGGQPQPLDVVAGDAGPQLGLPKLALHAPHHLEGMLEGVEVVVRALFDAPCEGELGEDS